MRVLAGTNDPQATLHVPRAVRVQGAVRLGYQSACDPADVGTLRYHSGFKEVQICSGLRWVRVTSTPVGQSQNFIPTSCDGVFMQNPALPAGSYYVKTAAGSEERFCTRATFAEPEPEPEPIADLVDTMSCTIPIAANYDRYATMANNSLCIVYGCNDTRAENYLSVVTDDDGSCFIAVYGCTNSHAPNFMANANVDDGTCFKACIETAPCESCQQAYDMDLRTGIWWIGTVQSGAHETFCDMDLALDFFRNKNLTRDASGGWALIMKATPGDTFEYNSDYWTGTPSSADRPSLNADVAILNADQSINMAVDAKYHAFNTMPARQYLVRQKTFLVTSCLRYSCH